MFDGHIPLTIWLGEEYRFFTFQLKPHQIAQGEKVLKNLMCDLAVCENVLPSSLLLPLGFSPAETSTIRASQGQAE